MNTPVHTDLADRLAPGGPTYRRMVETDLAAQAEILQRALWLPRGPKLTAALAYLARLGVIARDRILNGLPHASSAKAEHVAYSLARAPLAALSAKTRPKPLDHPRGQLIACLAHLQPTA